MNHTLPTRAKLASLLMLFFCVSAFAQLPNFSLTVTPTPQTCLGNGSLAFAVSGNNPAATMSYSVYLLPNTTTPLTIVTTPTVGGLVAGNYQVVATQTLSGESNTSTATVTIANNVSPLAYTLQPTNVRCGNDGVITVVTTSGTPVSYQIITGPVTAPLQTSNVFNNLPVGTYQVRVYDNCGEAVVTSIELIQLNPGMTVALGNAVSAELPSCTTIEVANIYNVGPNLNIFYPLTAQFTVYPPGGGAPIVVAGTAGGTAATGEAAATIPFYYDQQYYYNLVITDACGNTYTRNNNIVNEELGVAFSADYDMPGCGDIIFTLTPSIYVGPYTIAFTSAPAGFVPGDFSDDHPTFSGDSAIYGEPGNPVPVGEYAISLTDACGHTATLEFEVDPPEISPSINGDAACGDTTGTVTIIVPNRLVTLVRIDEAPDAYTGTLPDDVSEYINAFGGFEMSGLPLGDYVFYIEDSCGDVYTEPFTLIVTGGVPNMSFTQRPGCDEGDGSVRIQVTGSQITQLIITAAPAAFTETLPYNATSNIFNGSFYMNNLPEGTYTFSSTDNCGVTRTEPYTINGYHETVNEFTVIPLCGAFHLQVAHTSTTGTNLPSFFLQKYNPVTNTWGHPDTGLAYTEGTLPNINNSRLLNNNAINLNVQGIGQYRVLKVFYGFSNGSAASFRCIHEVANFEFDDAPEIVDAYTFPCAGGLNEVIIVATGVAPLEYSITEKNGEPFTINNGTSNLFSNLESATYNFQVTDDCGNIRNIQFDINSLDPTEIEPQGFCEGEDSSLTIDEFDFLDYEWYEQSNPGVILSTSGTLDFPDFSSADDAGTYILEITYDVNPNSCLNQTLQYVVTPNTLPNAGPDNTATLCNEGNVLNLASYLTAPFDAGGDWAETTASGALTGSQFDTDGVAAGTYTFTYTVEGGCDITDVATVSITLKDIPSAPVLDPVAAVCEGEDVQLTAETVPGATYHWTGPNGFESTTQNPVFAQAAPSVSGTYSAYVTVNGCISEIASVTVTVNALPQFTLQGSTQICEDQGSVISLEAINYDAAQATYAWFEEGQPMGIATSGLEVFSEGNYEVSVTVNGCTTTQSFVVELNNNAFSFDLDAGCVNENYIISVINLEGITDATYSWTGPNNYAYTGGPDADISELAGGIYTVTVTSPDGCSVTQNIDIDNTFCKIPRGISPNADTLNDTFDLSNLEVQHLIIFNRYGMKVFEANDYIDEWHGQSDSGDLPTGTYYYVATLSAGMQKTGWVYLQREIK